MDAIKYLIPPYRIRITRDSLNQPFYISELAFDVSKYNSLAKFIEKQILNEKGFLDLEVVKFNELLSYMKQAVEEKIIQHFEDKPPKLIKFIRDWIIYKITGFEQIIPLLIDDKVQEIYMDKPNTQLYIDHQDFGRCLTNIILLTNELERFKTRLCLEKNVTINILNPSIKVEFESDRFHVRAAIDIPPLASDGMSMNIRKLRKKIWTLPELIHHKMLTIEAAAYLLFLLKRRNNFTVIGEPGSGKTTLANAIDLLTPSQWRKITIEDVIESIEQTQFSKFQTRYSVSAFDSKISQNSKSHEIVKLLHRSPTWVFLGEIQTAEHSKALFEALSAGLIGIQTCHGRSIEMMIIRWMNQHDIPLSSIFTLDVLIENASNFFDWKINRYVNRIVEISKDKLCNGELIKSLNDLELVDIFRFDSTKAKLVRKIDLYNTPTMKSIKQREELTRESFESELNFFTSSLLHLIKNQLFNPIAVIDNISKERKQNTKLTFEEFH